ncbi:hypothetical protein DFP93_12350 [Aneurinibacillus soli]|uniref:Uncharacterized protein n=1 Tax=Aneurinibacillus soli TaxID=1500254 RepID=A0A0U4WMC4_9BACL|nr:hypothetical protein [Aneurinibacillus soli]PYE58504.1 hypothetical protein DFP93_12350 [Aneurinibacillus soli]BAU29480.1 hypothetical protein CB4_03680 [Aneurinibacillus soli]
MKPRIQSLLVAFCLVFGFQTVLHTPAEAAKSTRTLVQKKTVPTVAISGDKTFIAHTKAALALLKEKSPDDYALVVQYVGLIKQDAFSGMAAYEKIPTYKVGATTSSSTTTWYASTIVHDAYHSKLYNDYARTKKTAVPDDIWTGMKAEMQCLTRQTEALKKIKAPLSEQKYAQSLQNQNWWDSNGDGLYTEEDERMRSW